MRVPPPVKRRRYALRVETLELRALLSGGLTIPLDPNADQFGDQILTVQAYGGKDRIAFGVFDTGASAITFAASDQANFQAKGVPIPIRTPGGAHVAGIGGMSEGDVSEPGTIYADGIHAAKISFDPQGFMNVEADLSQAVSVGGVQAMVGTYSGSPSLPTITGSPIMNSGQAALIDFRGVEFDFSSAISGLTVSLADLHFVGAGAQLNAVEESTEPYTISLSPFGDKTSTGVTQSTVPVQASVQVYANGSTLGGRRFLFDTGAQMSIISTRTAQGLGLDLSNPSTSVGAGGTGGSSNLYGYTLDKLVVPSDRGPITWENVPVYVTDVYTGIDGVLGMNLFNSAVQMLYKPSAVSVTFEKFVSDHGPVVDQGEQIALGGLDHPLTQALSFAGLPSFQMPTGEVGGNLYQDLNGNGQQDRDEPGLANYVVYLDLNYNGALDSNEPQTKTDTNGAYSFAGLLPGEYSVRVVPKDGVEVSIPSDINASVGSDGNSPPKNVGAKPIAKDDAAALINGMYATVLHRIPDFVGKNFWVNQINVGLTMPDMAQMFWRSAEHRGLQVDEYYNAYLDRRADEAGRNYWIAAFQAGASEAQVRGGILGSTEYQQRHASPEALVRGLYSDVLNRQADPNGLTYWLAMLGNGASRAAITQAILNSSEAALTTIDDFYVRMLGRDSDGGGRAYWLYVLQQNQADWSTIAQSFLSSPEFLRKQRLQFPKS